MSYAESPIEYALRSLTDLDRENSKHRVLDLKTTYKAIDSLKIVISQGLTSQNQSEFLLSAQWLNHFVSKYDFKPLLTNSSPPNENYFHIMAEVLEDSFKILSWYIKSNGKDKDLPQRQEASIAILNGLYTKGGQDIKEKVMSEYSKLQPHIVRNMLMGKNGFDDAEVNYLSTSPSNGQNFLKQARRIMKVVPENDFVPSIKALLLEKKTKEIGKELARQLLRKVGFEDNEIVRQVESIENKPRFIADNVEAIFALEHKFHGISRWLMYEYGIEHFGRYPTEMLFNLHKYEEDKKSPWGIIIYPTHDHDNVFHEDYSTFYDLDNQLKEIEEKYNFTFRLRIIEGEDLSFMFDNIIRLVRKYGPVSLAIVGGHGNKDLIRFGEDDVLGVLTLDTVDNEKIFDRFIKRIFLPGSSAVFNSCFTGKEDGIVQSISKHGVIGIAPTEAALLEGLVVRLRGRKITIDPKYRKPETKNVFVNGRLVAKGK